MFSHYATRKRSTICKISTFSEDLSFLNPRSHLKCCENVFTIVFLYVKHFYESLGTNMINPFILSIFVKLRPADWSLPKTFWRASQWCSSLFRYARAIGVVICETRLFVDRLFQNHTRSKFLNLTPFLILILNSPLITIFKCRIKTFWNKRAKFFIEFKSCDMISSFFSMLFQEELTLLMSIYLNPLTTNVPII